MGHKLIDGVLWLLKVTIALAILFVLLANVSLGGASGFAADVLDGVGGTVKQLPDIVRDARGAGSGPAPTTTTRPPR